MPAAVAAQDVIAEARRLTPLLAEYAEEAEAGRRPPAVVMDALREARIFELMTPERFGGLELDVDTFLDVGLALAEGDASMGWLTGFYVMHNWMFSHFPMEFQEQIYASGSYVLAPAAIAPSGTAEEVDGGFRVSGRWSWGTGINDADEWVIVGSFTPNPDGGRPKIWMCAVPRDEVRVEDTWHTSGMRATGSHDMIIENAFVPAERTVLASVMAEGVESPLHDAPLYRLPMMPMLMLAVALPAVGQAKASVRRFAETIQNRTLLGTKTKQSETAAAQMRLARAELEVLQAEQQVRVMVAELMELRNNAQVPDRARLAAKLAIAVDQSKRVIQSLAESSGASVYFSKDPLQRALRDVQMGSCHPTLNLDFRLEMLGRVMLGLDPGGPV